MIFVTVVLGLMVMSSCAQSQTPMKTQDSLAKQDDPYGQETPKIDTDFEEVGTIEPQVSDSDLDGLESELEELDW